MCINGDILRCFPGAGRKRGGMGKIVHGESKKAMFKFFSHQTKRGRGTIIIMPRCGGISEGRLEKTERRKRILINLVYFAAILAVLIVLFRYMMSSLLPFFIAFIVAAMIHPLLDKLTKRCHLPHKLTGIVLIVLVYTLLAFLGIILCDKIADFVQKMIVLTPRVWSSTMLPTLRSAWESITAFLARWDIEIDLAMDKVLAALDSSIKTVSAKAVAMVGNFAVSVPGKLVNTIICIVSTVFILLDWDAIGKFVHDQLPPKASAVMADGWSQLKKTMGKYIRSYGLIMLMTFTELAIGLLIIGVDNSWGVAAGIALLDILPIVGCGTVLIPWAAVSLVTGKTGLAVSLMILYVIIAIVRNIAEPKIVGQQVGLHPLATLLAMVMGASLFGAAGVLALPIALAVIKQLNDDGIIHVIKKPEPEEKAKAPSKKTK